MSKPAETLNPVEEVNMSVKELTEQLARMKEIVKLAKAKEKMAGTKIDPLLVVAVVGEYNGNKTLCLKPTEHADPRSKFDGCLNFGVKKAQLILASLDAIKRFVAENSVA